ncbi:DUF6287 domain-containing protein [Streptococcus mitis]|uniref:DUF6287 domain-containing protein n=1 Tax=Streptococcus mitis TaxID=28037 RepID=UPI0021B5FA04|nr:DUF6287 domain-containing protein [Streptococcus mitis]
MRSRKLVKNSEEINEYNHNAVGKSEVISTAKAIQSSFKIKVYIGIAISLLVVAILASLFLFSPNAKKESNEAISSVAKKENTSKEAIDTSKASENDKKKEEEIQKLKEQLTSLDSKVSESEKVVSKLKEETAVPKLDIEALRNNDLSSLKGTWRSQSGNEYIIKNSGEVDATWFTNDQKYESVVELKISKGQDSRNPETASLSAWVKDSVAGGFVVVAVPSGVIMQPGDDGKITDKSNHAEERLLSGQDYGSMLMKPEDVYYRVKPDTSKLEEEEKNLAQLQAEREAIKTSLESKEKKNTN